MHLAWVGMKGTGDEMGGQGAGGCRAEELSGSQHLCGKGAKERRPWPGDGLGTPWRQHTWGSQQVL